MLAYDFGYNRWPKEFRIMLEKDYIPEKFSEELNLVDRQASCQIIILNHDVLLSVPAALSSNFYVNTG